jgi:hypothetical protein
MAVSQQHDCQPDCKFYDSRRIAFQSDGSNALYSILRASLSFVVRRRALSTLFCETLVKTYRPQPGLVDTDLNMLSSVLHVVDIYI